LTTTPSGLRATEFTGDGLDGTVHTIDAASELLEYLHEPDGAVIRAGLVAHLANELDGALIDPSIAYFTSDTPVYADGSSISQAYRIVEAIPYNVKTLRAYLKDRKVGRVTIKKRGISVTPEQLRPQLALKGENEATIILTRVNDKKTAIIVDPLQP
jgi:hypothetical protein